jgi:hypothetical protein
LSRFVDRSCHSESFVDESAEEPEVQSPLKQQAREETQGANTGGSKASRQLDLQEMEKASRQLPRKRKSKVPPELRRHQTLTYLWGNQVLLFLLGL